MNWTEDELRPCGFDFSSSTSSFFFFSLFLLFFFFFLNPRVVFLLAEKGILSSFRLSRKEDDQSSNSPFGSRKKGEDKDKDVIDPAHPFGPPRRSGAESKSVSDLSAKEGGSPLMGRKKRDSNSSIDNKDSLPPSAASASSSSVADSETDDTESSMQAHEAAVAAAAAAAIISSSPSAGSAVGGASASQNSGVSPAPVASSNHAPAVTSSESAKISVAVTVQATGQTHDFEYDSHWQVRAVMANLAAKLNVDKNSSLFHPIAHVFLEPQRELQCYWDLEPSVLPLTIVTSTKASTKEAKVKVGSVKRSVHVMKQTTASGIVMLAGEETGFHPAHHVLLVGEKPTPPNTVVWKTIGSDWAVVPLTELAPVNLRVNFADDQVVKVCKLGEYCVLV